jgi:hypothetical protein
MNDPFPDAGPALQPGPVAALTRRLLEWLHRYRYALAPLSFGLGLASFFLVERQEPLAQWLSALLLAGWVLLTFDEAAARRLKLPPALLRFGIQAIQQETFFFALPFFLHTTSWDTGQGVFTGFVIAAGACSMWDPLYHERIAARPWLYLLFHAFAVFIGTLVVAPMLLHLTTTQTLAMAAIAIAVLSVPGLLHMIDRRSALHWLLLLGGAAALGGLAWSIRAFVPPATLWVNAALITDAVNAAQRAPGAALASVSPGHLHQQGLYAYTAIRAPRGLREQVFHRWMHEGAEVDRIPMEIRGGRAEGYRAWSHKRGFPRDPRGHWEVHVVTGAGQLIGRVRFEVVGGDAGAPPAVAPDLPLREPEALPEAEMPPQPLPEAPQDPQAPFAEPVVPEEPQPGPDPGPDPDPDPDNLRT